MSAWTTLLRATLLLSVFVLPGAYLTYSAAVRPSIEFLPGSYQGEWAFYPDQKVKMRGRPVSQDVVFWRDFDLESVPDSFDFRLFAFTEMVVTINGKETRPRQSRPSWKHAATFELAPHLRAGRNRLLVRVHNGRALPGMLVESPSELATPGGWQVRVDGNRAGFSPVVSPGERESNPGLIQRSPWWSWLRWSVWLWLALVAATGVWVLGREALGLGNEGERPRISWPWLRWLVPALLLAGSFGLNLYNASIYPHDFGGFDWWGHLEYIKIVALEWRVPLADEAWQTYQPPLYYCWAALVYVLAGGEANEAGAIRIVQYFGVTVGLGLSVLTWLTVRRVMRDNEPAQWVALAFAAFLPMSLYMNPQVTNEVFAATVIAAGIYCAILLIERPRISPWLAALAGCVAGAGLLSKFGGLLPLGAIGMALSFRAIQRRQRDDFLSVVAFGLGVFAVCGWFYGRNVATFGHLFASNWGHDTGQHVEQLPTYRTFDFYAGFGRVFFDHPTQSVWSSFGDGNYGTMWADARFAFFSDLEDPAFGWMGATILIAALPSMVILMGMAQMWMSALRKPAANRDVVMVVASLWTFAALVLYTMEVPTYSVIKAFYFLFLVPTLGLCLARGREMLRRQLPWSCRLLDGTVVVLVAMAVWIYRFPGDAP